MLYVFHVDTGTMMTFEMNVALQSVVYLKQIIERKCGVEAAVQVLLVSGGEVLQNEAKVGSYSAGTDTNPIFMFSKAVKDDPSAPSHPPFVPDCSLELDFRLEAEDCCAMTPSLNTIITCANLAKRMVKNAHDLARSCENVVHEQHLQHQGWAAVVANMEDITDEFRDRADDFDERFKDHLGRKAEYIEFLSRFGDDLEKLASIPILPALRLNAASNPFTAFDELHADSETFEKQEDSDENPDGEQRKNKEQMEGSENIALSDRIPRQRDREALTLLHWITARENQDSLKQIAEYCAKGLDLLESATMENLRQEISKVLEGSVLARVKQIKGLEDRLYGLDQLMSETKKLEQEQQDLAQSFSQNQMRATESGDPSVMGTLCASHKRQLYCMLNNQSRLTDIRRRCIRAKYELATNLDSRLGWIVYIENRMFDIDSKMMFYNRWLARLRRHFSVVEQLHRAPALFVSAVREVVRRRTFSQAFIAWASDLACHLLTIHNEEVMRRREFGARFSGHFLTGLFPGTDDLPPPFGTQAPRVFDGSLPRLTGKDVTTINEKLPDIANSLLTYDMAHVTNFFVSRSGQPKIEQKIEEKKEPEEMPVTISVIKENPSDRGCESETDTEEFEKVGGSEKVVRRGGLVRGRGKGVLFYVGETPPSSPDRSPRPTQEEFELQKLEIEKYKGLLLEVTQKCNESIGLLKDDIEKLKSEFNVQKDQITSEFVTILEKWQECSSDMALRHRETLQRLTVDHELEMNDIKQLLNAKDEEIRTLKADHIVLQNSSDEKIKEIESSKKGLEETIEELHNSSKVLETKLVEADVIKQKEIKELQDRMAHECKAELESLRSRFRLVALTSMDRSPSESSLEKIERPDMIEIANHKQILAQTREDFELEKEEAIQKALEDQERVFKDKMATSNLNDNVRRIIDEKDRQLEHFRERELALIKESNKYKETIQQLTDPETTDYQSMCELKGRVNTLENEKIHLEDEMKRLKAALEEKVKVANVCDMSTQLGSVPSAATSQPSTESKSSSTMTESGIGQSAAWKSAVTSINPGLSLSNCGPGDIVLLMWDSYHHNYTVLQESTTLYFVHTDSLAGLDLKLRMKDESKRKLHCLGQVESKEYCYAKKSDNRYKVEKGTRFYHVKVKPLPTMSQSEAVPVIPQKKDATSEANMSQSVFVVTDAAAAIGQVVEATRKQRMVKSAIIPSEAASAPASTPPIITEEIPPAPFQVPDPPAKSSTEENLDSIESCEAAKLEGSIKVNLLSEEQPSKILPVSEEDRLESETAEEALP